MFQRDWFQIIQRDEVPRGIKLSRFWDRAATAPKEGTDPDYTAGALVVRRQLLAAIVAMMTRQTELGVLTCVADGSTWARRARHPL